MRLENISNNNFGMRITDNFYLQALQHFLIRNHGAPQVKSSFVRIQNCERDSFELTFQEFATGKPCEVLLRKFPSAPHKFFVTFADVKEKIKKRGRPSKQAENLLYNQITPQKLAEIIIKNTQQYAKQLSN